MEAGDRRGPYLILGPLGAGGMGEVYRARDEKLGREVAIKVLPDSVVADPDRLRRFEQEARAVGALNHPNILVVHGFDAHDGAPFLVTELLDGQTLRERIRAGDLSPRKAIEIAAQIAAGLAAAHERGIVHRDLKPENLFLTLDGVAKILDFGLAKPIDGGMAGPSATATARTRKLPGADATLPGTVMGTPGYMAPEQVRGLAVDHRADIFALGCVLYEMIAGRSPFARETPADTLGAILTADPLPLPEPGTAIPPGVVRSIAHCLEKQPGDRFQSARDLAFDLRTILADSDPSTAAARGPVSGPEIPSPRRRRPTMPLLTGLAGGLAIVVAGWLWRGPVPWRVPGVEARRIVVTVLENETGDPSLDPIGRMTSDWITQGLLRIQGLDVVPSTSLLFTRPLDMSAAGAGNDSWRQLLKETGAGTVISGAYYRRGETLQFQVKVSDAASGKLILALDPVTGPANQPMQAIDELQQRLMGAIAAREEAAHYISARQDPPLYDAYREFIAGFELFMTDEDQALRHFQRSAVIDTTFWAPLLYEAYLYDRRGDHARTDRILEQLASKREKLAPLTRYWLDSIAAYVAHRYPEALQVLRNAQTLAPRDPLLNHWIGYLALMSNRPRETIETFGEFGSRPWSGHPLGAEWVRLLCIARHMLGEHRQELAAARHGGATISDPLAISVLEVEALAALGRVAELEEIVSRSRAATSTGTPAGDVMLGAAMELRAHGHREASLASAELAASWFRQQSSAAPGRNDLREGLLDALRWAEDWDQVADLCRVRLRAAPDDVKALGVLGSIAARRGDREEALRFSAALDAMTGPYLFGTAVYGRACIAALLGDETQAMDLLHQAFAEGRPYGIGHHRQIDLEPLWDRPAFRALLKPHD